MGGGFVGLGCVPWVVRVPGFLWFRLIRFLLWVVLRVRCDLLVWVVDLYMKGFD